MTNLVSSKFLKQVAKKLKKGLDLTHHQALDEASKMYGFSNYRHYLNVLEESESLEEKNIPLKNTVSKKIEFEMPFEQSSQMSFNEQLDFLKVFQNSEDVQTQCEKWNLMKDEIKSALFNEFLTEVGENEIDFRYKYYIAKDISVKDLEYEIKGDILCVDGEYDLTIKLNADDSLPTNYQEIPNFQDHILSGSFGIKLDKDRNIAIPHLNIIQFIDGLVYAGTVKPTARLMPPFRPELATFIL